MLPPRSNALEEAMLEYVGAHYATLVIVAMTMFAVTLFGVSLADTLKSKK